MGKLFVFSLKKVVIVLVILLLCCVSILLYQTYVNTALKKQVAALNICNADAGTKNYQVGTSEDTWRNVDHFLATGEDSTVKYLALKKSLTFVLQNTKGKYSLYFEDLNTGAWFGVDEEETYMPLSLLKVPILITTLKEIELGNVSMNHVVVLETADLDSKSGDLWKNGAGYEITVKDLLITMIKHSDNTALLALSRHVVSDSTFAEAKLGMGLPPMINDTAVSPKQYANMLRGLYFSNYLRKPFSEVALSLMMETDFNSQIPAGLPKDVKVAHKVGIYNLGGYYHDCGIVYAPNHPYILCVMSKNTDLAEADKVISQSSKIVYDYISTVSK